MATRYEIITNLFADLNNNLKVSNGYATKIYDTRFGVFDPNEFSALPAAGLWVIDDVLENDIMDESTFRRLNMICYGYDNATETDLYTSFYQFIADIEKFLYSTDNRYYKNVLLGDVDITYGGASQQIGLFVVNFSILYSQSGLES